MKVELYVNDKYYVREGVSPDRRLLDFLRNDLGLKGTKEGCSQGECGACSVILNKKIVNSCLILMAQLPPKSEIMTIESQNEIIQSLQDSFIQKGATQCGACTPGMILASAALLEKHPKATYEQIKEGLSGVLCRCTGYTKIYDAVKDTQERISKLD